MVQVPRKQNWFTYNKRIEDKKKKVQKEKLLIYKAKGHHSHRWCADSSTPRQVYSSHDSSIHL